MSVNLQKNFNEAIKEIFDLRGLNAKKIAELTDIPESHILALLDNDLKKLPAFPYVRGYILKIAEISNLNAKDFEDLLELYKKEIPEDIGESDKLPFNRFARQLTNKRKIIFQIVLVLILVYLSLRIDYLIGVPELKISNPQENNLIVKKPTIKLSGTANNFFDKLIINNEEIPIDKNGFFEKDFNLQPGENTIEFKIKRFLGKEIKIEKKITYQPE
ncbi:helix-turn-helix domain-containing protein [Candidatus Wolfebacteria bacterium]|nr:helix-turn-helix domain-containing protein [Candidatus Wolfebacteria bacterium]